MAELDLEKLERLAKAATPGPWAVDDESTQDFGRLYVAKGRTGKLLGRIAEVFENCLVRDKAERESNAQFIAAARNALPALIARIRELEQDAARLDFIESHAEPGREWHVRTFLNGKGFRLHLERIPGEKTARAAIDAARKEKGHG